MWKRPVSIIILTYGQFLNILFIRNKIFSLCVGKKNIFFWRERLFPQSSHRYLTYSYRRRRFRNAGGMVQNLKLALHYDPASSFAYYELYLTYQAMGDTGQAAASLRGILAMQPKSLPRNTNRMMHGRIF